MIFNILGEGASELSEIGMHPQKKFPSGLSSLPRLARRLELVILLPRLRAKAW